MRAMVFAAGYGQRLLPVTQGLPKALIPVAGRPMIEYSLLLLKYYGIGEVILNVHHLGEKIEEYLGDGEKLGLKVFYSRERELLDTGGGLFCARRFFLNETFVVINSDVVIDLSLKELIDAHRRRRAIATLVLRPAPDADLYGSIEISNDLRIQRFLDSRAPQNQPLGSLTKLMFTGVQVLEPKIFDYMEPGSAEVPPRFGITRTTYPRMVTRGEELYGFPFKGFWQDLGTADRLKEAEEKLANGKIKLHYL
jgi:mannose-1-phosphate guanylyltransferase